MARSPQVRNKRNGWPEGAIFVGRPTRWGNPWKAGRDGTRDEVILRYFEYLKTRPDLIARLDKLKGHDLLCYCAPKFCHADILLLLANATPEEREEMLALDTLL